MNIYLPIDSDQLFCISYVFDVDVMNKSNDVCDDEGITYFKGQIKTEENYRFHYNVITDQVAT